MYSVKRVEAQDLLSELKTFALSRSPELHRGTDSGYEEQRTFYHDDPVPRSVAHGKRYAGRVMRELCKSTFGFAVFRTPPVRNKRSFSYMLSAEIERTLPVLDEKRLRLLSAEVLEAYDHFTEVEEGILTEATAIELETSDHELREIDVSQKYSLAYYGDTIYEATDADVLYGMAGTVERIAPIESVEHDDRLFIAEPIGHESLPPVENVITNLGFWAIVEPFGVSLDQGVDYRSAAVQMRAIMHTLRTGRYMDCPPQKPEPSSE